MEMFRVHFTQSIAFKTGCALLIFLSAACAFIVAQDYIRSRDGELARLSPALAANTERAAAEAEIVFRGAYAAARSPRDVDSVGAVFFQRYPDIIALASTSGLAAVNTNYFRDNGIDRAVLQRYLDTEKELISRVLVSLNGEVLLGNAAPFFGKPVVALFFLEAPENDSVRVAFLDTDNLNALVETGEFPVFCVNKRDDLILHSDPDAILRGDNIWQEPPVRIMRQSQAGADTISWRNENGETYLGAFYKLPIGGAVMLGAVPQKIMLGAARKTMLHHILICIIVIIAAAIFCLIFSKIITRSIGKTLNILLQLQNGQFEQSLSESIKSDIDILRNNIVLFGKMVVEREKLQHIFCNLTGKQRLNTEALRDVRLDGELKKVTCLLTNAENFYALSKKFSPQKTLETLNRTLSLSIDCITGTNGFADRIEGPSLTGVWGAPLSAGSDMLDAINAVRAALTLRAALIKFNSDEGFENPLHVSCGISSGVALAGVTGSQERSLYTLSGKLEKNARDLQKLNKKTGTDILISENTKRLVENYFILEKLTKIKYAKKSEPVYAVINIKVTKKGEAQPLPTNFNELRNMLAAGKNV
jgi:adenylate cyclase